MLGGNLGSLFYGDVSVMQYVISHFGIDDRILIVIVSVPIHLSLVMRKPVFGVSDLVRHKPGCAVTEDG